MLSPKYFKTTGQLKKNLTVLQKKEESNPENRKNLLTYIKLKTATVPHDQDAN
jgi:hypothetical protein